MVAAGGNGRGFQPRARSTNAPRASSATSAWARSTAASIAGKRATRERILDAAGRLFAERGFDGTSLRAITTAAGVNLAAVHYHLGSKEALLAAIVARHAEPVNRERLARLPHDPYRSVRR